MEVDGGLTDGHLLGRHVGGKSDRGGIVDGDDTSNADSLRRTFDTSKEIAVVQLNKRVTSKTTNSRPHGHVALTCTLPTTTFN